MALGGHGETRFRVRVSPFPPNPKAATLMSVHAARQRLRDLRRKAAALVGVLVLGGSVAWADDLVLADPGIVWKALLDELGPTALARLRLVQGLDAAIGTLLGGLDGDGDEVRVVRSPDGLRVTVTPYVRVCPVALQGGESGVSGPDAPPPDAPCPLVPDPAGPRFLELDARLWTTPAERPKAPRPPTPATPPIADPPAVEPSRGTLMRIRLGTAPWEVLLDFLPDDLRTRHLIWREAQARSPWRDPLLPKSALAAGDALAPLPTFEAPRDAAYDNLRDPFDDSRMRTADPVPNILRQPGRAPAAPGTLPGAIPRLTDECRDAVASPLRHVDPPRLECFRAAAWNARYLLSSLPEPLRMLTDVLSLPGWNEVRMGLAAEAMDSEAWRATWAAQWLAWVDAKPARIDDALRRLEAEERRVLRRRIGHAYAGRGSGDFARIVELLVETRFIGLYPEARDVDGLPRHSFFDDPWLWAGNWVFEAAHRSQEGLSPAVDRALQALTVAELGTLTARLGESVPRWPGLGWVSARVAALTTVSNGR